MYGLVNNYPMTNFHEINLDYIIKLVRENNGLHLDVSGNQLLLKTLDGTTVSSVTVHYAETAGHADTATSATNATYATTASTASSATNATNAGHALTADTATTAGTAQTATTATTAGTATEATHATTADTALTANTATRASTADYATTTGNVEHADKAVESVVISGDTVKFITYDGTETSITVPYSVKALKDSLGNEIKSTYITNVVDDNGTLKFKDAEGNDVVSLVPSVETASNDSYGNLIADMVKTIAVSSNSNYVTVTRGTGTTQTLTINYSERAYKDTNDNVIKNTYIKSLTMVEDDDTGHYNLVAYNGDNPTAEIFRLELIAYRAQIADDATHASSADYATSAGYATNAGTAQTAVTSTGSISSITTPSDEYDSFTINNGDGTTKKIDIHNKSIIEINLYGDGIKTNPNDLAVNASEDYEVDTDDLSKYRYISDIDDVITPNINFVYNEQSGGLVIFNAISQQTTISGNTAITLSVFNGTSVVVLKIAKSNTDGYVTITRLV